MGFLDLAIEELPQAFLGKPYDFDDLRDTVHRILLEKKLENIKRSHCNVEPVSLLRVEAFIIAGRMHSHGVLQFSKPCRISGFLEITGCWPENHIKTQPHSSRISPFSVLL